MARKNRYHLSTNRIVVHIDVDFFEVQVFLKDYPQYRDYPCIVIKKIVNKRNGNPRIVSVNALAKGFGITRDDRHRSALKKCPELKCFEQEVKYNRSWDHKNLQESDDILDVIVNYVKLHDNSIVINRDSIDGFFLDITEYCRRSEQQFSYQLLESLGVKIESGTKLSHKIGQNYSTLTTAAVFAYKLRKEILIETEFQTSVGISYNQLLAKIGCEFNKPNNITIIHSKPGIARIFGQLDIGHIWGFKRQLGHQVHEKLGISKAIEMRNYRKMSLNKIFNNKVIAKKIWESARGIDRSKVVPKLQFNQVTCGRNYFTGTHLDPDFLDITLECMAFCEKLSYDFNKNKRIAKHIRIEFTIIDSKGELDIVSGKVYLYTQNQYNFDDITEDIIIEAQRVLEGKAYYYSKFVANMFSTVGPKVVSKPKPIEPKVVSKPKTKIEKQKTKTSDDNVIPINSIRVCALSPYRPTQEERYEEFMRTNGHRLYVNTVYDY